MSSLTGSLKRRVLLKAWRFLHRLGYNVRRAEHDCWDDQRSLLAGSDVRVIFDVGANAGDVTRLYHQAYPASTIFCFEALPDCCAQLDARFAVTPQVCIHNLAVSDRVGEAEFYVNSAKDTSSLLPSDLEHLPASYQSLNRTRETIRVKTTTIDAFCRENNIPCIDILKMDIQGGELAALRGAAEMLREGRIRLLYSEVFFVPFYQGHPLFGDIALYLGQMQYRLHYLYNLSFNGSSGRLFWGDAVFVCPLLAGESTKRLQLAARG
jgi:FkbM family methyltransferase